MGLFFKKRLTPEQVGSELAMLAIGIHKGLGIGKTSQEFISRCGKRTYLDESLALWVFAADFTIWKDLDPQASDRATNGLNSILNEYMRSSGPSALAANVEARVAQYAKAIGQSPTPESVRRVARVFTDACGTEDYFMLMAAGAIFSGAVKTLSETIRDYKIVP